MRPDGPGLRVVHSCHVTAESSRLTDDLIHGHFQRAAV